MITLESEHFYYVNAIFYYFTRRSSLFLLRFDDISKHATELSVSRWLLEEILIKVKFCNPLGFL